MSNYIPLNIQLFATSEPEKTTFEVYVYEHNREDGSVEVTLNASGTMAGLYSQKYDKDVSLEWSDSFPISTVSRIFTEPYDDIIICRSRFGEEYTVHIDVNPESIINPDPTPSTSVNGIISLNGVNFSDIQFNNNQVSAVYYNGTCVWTLDEEEKAPENAITYNGEYVIYNNKYIIYKEEK